MDPAMDIPELAIGNMSINLGRGDIAVAQKFLNRSQIDPLIQQIGGERMAQGMGSSHNREPGDLYIFFNDILDALNGQTARLIASGTATAIVDKQGVIHILAFVEITLEGGHGSFGKINSPDFAAFTDNRHFDVLGIGSQAQLIAIKRGQFRYTQAGRK